uniref:protoporphyrinogen oxidase n=1 Tax=Gordonia sp. B7-2 TaxID=3420932 RepID=UPI003D93B7E5
MAHRARVAVIGGGISGLTAALRLRQGLGPDAHIDVFDAGDRLGGILHTTEVGGRQVDVGAEAFIVRRPEALELVRELGLGDRVVSPTAMRPAIWSGGGLYPLPAPALMGIPASVESVAELVDSDDLTRMSAEADRELRWRAGADPSVGDFVADRFGPSVVARSVDPMLGGVYSSLAADIGVREALPALATRLDAGAPSLTTAVNEVIGAGAGASGPVFGTLVGGYRVLVDALVEAASANVRLGGTITGLRHERDSWAIGVDDDPQEYDAVILAVPAQVAAALLASECPGMAGPLAEVSGASSVVVSLALAPATRLPDHSGVLVATGEQLRAKAFTFSSQKWEHLADRCAPVSVRASFGRFGAPVPSELEEPGVDDRLVAEALADLDEVCDAAGVGALSSQITDVVVQRWTGGLPVYAPGHLARMAEVLAGRPRRLALAGSAYGGVGVPACIAQAGRAAAEVLADLG